MTFKTVFTVVSLLMFTLVLTSSESDASAGSDSIVIIGNKHFKGNQISKADVKHLFQKEKERISGSKAMPIHAKKSSSLRKLFNKKVLGMSVSKEETYWQQKKVKSGKLPPKEMGNTVRGVAMVRGAIGYTFESEVKDNNVKILLKL